MCRLRLNSSIVSIILPGIILCFILRRCNDGERGQLTAVIREVFFIYPVQKQHKNCNLSTYNMHFAALCLISAAWNCYMQEYFHANNSHKDRKNGVIWQNEELLYYILPHTI